jgi:hypothetical protein
MTAKRESIGDCPACSQPVRSVLLTWAPRNIFLWLAGRRARRQGTLTATFGPCGHTATGTHVGQWAAAGDDPALSVFCSEVEADGPPSRGSTTTARYSVPGYAGATRPATTNRARARTQRSVFSRWYPDWREDLGITFKIALWLLVVAAIVVACEWTAA